MLLSAGFPEIMSVLVNSGTGVVQRRAHVRYPWQRILTIEMAGDMNPATLPANQPQTGDSREPNALTPKRGISQRLVSLDIIRGAVMVLMAIDHVRVFSGLPAGGPSPGIFFTRWITHFCAPIFVFLTGTGAYLYGKKHGNVAAVSRYLVIRGVWLVLLELTILRFAWTFNFDYSHYMLAGVIWMIGWCMILTALLVRLPIFALTVFSIAIIAGHNITDSYVQQLAPLANGKIGWLWKSLYFGGALTFGSGGPTILILYTILPWLAVMTAGYAFGTVMLMDKARRRRLCFALGTSAIIIFIVLRVLSVYGDPRPWKTAPRPASVPAAQPSKVQAANVAQPSGAPPEHGSSGGASRTSPISPADSAPRSSTSSVPRPASAPVRRPMPRWLAFLNTTKYPASFLFLLMTLGPFFLAVALLEENHSRLGEILNVFGRVPLFYYVLHIPLIHFAAILVSLVRTGAVTGWLFTNHPVGNPQPPEGYTWSLGLLYLVFFCVLVPLYFLCNWFAKLKKTQQWEWLSFF